MSELLFLSHRIPYPPDKGDKIRSFHVLRELAKRHTVHVGTFIDDPADWQHVEALRRLCGGETCVRPLEPRRARLRSLRGLLGDEPLSVAYYRDAQLARWVKDVGIRRPLGGVFAFSSSMCQYASIVPLAGRAPRVVDFCDVDSDKWRQYAASHRFPLNVVYRREAALLARLEGRCAGQFDASLVISEAEASLLRALAGRARDRVRVVPNGVDTQFFDPATSYPNPFETSVLPIVFTGAMDYQANVDGVRWFASEVLPGVRQREPRARFVIVGSNPASAVTALAKPQETVVTGRVPDVRPYLAHAAVVVAPLRIARGVQNKVLEAMAMARPVVATENALQGIPEASQAGICVASDPGRMADAVCSVLAGAAAEPRGRECVRQHYSWNDHLETVGLLFDRVVSSGADVNAARTALA